MDIKNRVWCSCTSPSLRDDLRGIHASLGGSRGFQESAPRVFMLTRPDA